jgi:hypothetical protein
MLVLAIASASGQGSDLAAGKSDVPSAAKLGLQRDQIKELVAQFGSDVFQVRESATEKLASELSELDLPILKEILAEQQDLETRVRLSGIISKLKQDRLQTQVRDFLRARDTRQTYGFDGWLSFSKYSGNSRNAKLLFLRLLDRFPELVEKELESKQQAIEMGRVVGTRLNENNLTGRSAEIEDGLALLYCMNASEDLFSKEFEPLCLFTFRTAPFGSFILESQGRKPLELMLLAWGMKTVDSRRGCLQLFIEKELPQVRELAVDFLQTKSAKVDDDAYLMSLQALYRFGTRDDLKHVIPWLDDDSVCFETQRIVYPDKPVLGPDGSLQPPNPTIEPYTVQRRDAALLTAIRLAGDDQLAFFPMLVPHFLRGYQTQSIALPVNANDERRKRIESWRQSTSNDNPS